MLEMAYGREVCAAVARVPHGMGTLALRYLGLFRTNKRAMSGEKAAKLINELVPMMADARVRSKGRDWLVPIAQWREAIEGLLDVERRPKTLVLPLKDNNYLIAIVCNKANSAEAKAESASEAKRAGRTPNSPPLPLGEGRGEGIAAAPAKAPEPTAVPYIPAEIQAQIAKLRSKSTGKKPIEKPRQKVIILSGQYKGKYGNLLRANSAISTVALDESTQFAQRTIEVRNEQVGSIA
jgi:hypothetical protein